MNRSAFAPALRRDTSALVGLAVAIAAILATITVVEAQAPRSSPPPPPLPQTFFSGEVPIRVIPVAKGLSHPWSLAFLPDGGMLVTERDGRLRIIHNGVLDPKPIAGVPAVFARVLGGLLDVALHPAFAQNRFVYLSYSKAGDNNLSTTALARGRFDGTALTDVKDIFVANTWSKSNTNYGGRIAFDRAGFLYLTIGERQEQQRAQDVKDHGGKVLRLRDDGTVPMDNPFVGRAGYQPEIYSLGHRSPQGLAMNPATGAIWENEHGPLGGDELNVLKAGANYGWPLVTFGTDYDGTKVSDATTRADLEAPFVYWVPSIAVSGLTFYTGDRFPQWKGNVFVGAMFAGRSRGTGHVQRIVINDAGRPINREPLLAELRQRIRDVRQGPDGLLYLLTDEDDGMVLRLEPGAQLAAPNASGVAMGHLHYRVRDLDANKKFWLALGGEEVQGLAQARPGAGRGQAPASPQTILKFQDVLVVLEQGDSPGGTEGSVVNHVAFRVPSFAQVDAAGLMVARLNGFPGVGSVMTPEGERIELFENAATNLTFTQDAGFDDAVARRHNRPLTVPIAFHHVHLYVPDGQVAAAKAWYVRMFVGIPGKRSNYEAVDLPGINLNFSAAPKPTVPTKGRMLDHIGFEVRGLAAFCQRLEGLGVTLDVPYTRGPSGLGTARLTDPWGTSIELTEGLGGV
jgi:glucose/arabinose dehydrogenase/catechol 2,3-dioxygenase-like lactoylglutathione lyase family enzyme